MAYEVVRRRDEATAAGRGAGDDRLFVIDESLGYLVNYLARGFARALAAALRPHGVSPAQWAVLMFLWAEDGQTQAALSRQVAIEEATMVRTLDRMERDGLVRRVRDPRDRRRSNVFLTERGQALRDVLVPGAIAVNEAASRGFDDAERRQLRESFRRLIAALEDDPPQADGGSER